MNLNLKTNLFIFQLNGESATLFLMVKINNVDKSFLLPPDKSYMYSKKYTCTILLTYMSQLTT